MWRVSVSPRWLQVSPASVDLYTPAPHGELCRLLASPVPIQTMSGSDGATVTSPIELTCSSSNNDCQVVPRLVVFHRFPEATPT